MIASTFAGTGAWTTAEVSVSVQVNSIEYGGSAFNAAKAGVDFKTLKIHLTLAGNGTASFDIIDPSGTTVVPILSDVQIWDAGASLYYMSPSFSNDGPYAVAIPNGLIFSGLVTSYESKAFSAGQVISVEATDLGFLLDHTYVPSPAFNLHDQVTVAAALANQGGIPSPIVWDAILNGGSAQAGGTAASAGTTRSLLDQAIQAATTFGGLAQPVFVAPWRSLLVNGTLDPEFQLSNAGTVLTSVLPFKHKQFAASQTCYSQAVWESSPVSYWRMDESTSWSPQTAFDLMNAVVSSLGGAGGLNGISATIAQGGNPGLYENSPTLNVAGPMSADPGTGVTFASASLQYVTVANPVTKSLDLGDNVSFECWVKRSSAAVAGLMNKGTGYLQVTWNSDNTVIAAAAGVGTFLQSTATMASDGNWHHLAVTKAGATAAIFIDGVNAGGTYSAQTLVNTSSALELARQSGATNYFNGTMAHAAIFGRALRADEVVRHYGSRANTLGIAPAENFAYGVDAGGTESAVWNSATSSWVYSDTVLGTGTLYAQSFNRQLATGSIPTGQTAASYLPDRSTRTVVSFSTTSFEAYFPDTTISVNFPQVNLPTTSLLVSEVQMEFLAGNGLRRTTITAGGQHLGGSRRSAMRSLQQRLTVGNL